MEVRRVVAAMCCMGGGLQRSPVRACAACLVVALRGGRYAGAHRPRGSPTEPFWPGAPARHLARWRRRAGGRSAGCMKSLLRPRPSVSHAAGRLCRASWQNHHTAGMGLESVVSVCAACCGLRR
eukprot:4517603-Prymnesium_polylepis.1